MQDNAIDNAIDEVPSNEVTNKLNEMIDKLVKQEVEGIARQTPIVVDSQTVLTSVIYVNGIVNFLYLFHSLDVHDMDEELFTKKMIEFTRNKFCTDPDAKIFRNLAKDTLVKWTYVDSKGVVVAKISMKGAECGLP